MKTRPRPNSRLLLLLFWLASAAANAESPPRLVIIIDDLGYQLEAGRRAAELPGKINLSILPHTPNGATVARLGMAAGKEILLHAPMSNINDKPLGGGALTVSMSERMLRHTLERSLDRTPGVRGVNNHMGSLLTTRREPMEWVMGVLANRGLYYIDSRTSTASIAASVAQEYGVPNLSRSVFLDNKRDPWAIHLRFVEALAVADRNGIAIAIGHPHEETLHYLQRELPLLEERGYRLSLISEVLAPQLARMPGEQTPAEQPPGEIAAD